MARFENPALKEFAAQIGNEFTLAQVLIRRAEAGFELRHANDRAALAKTLRLVRLDEARQLAQYTAAGEFRPLKSSPTLQRGWRMSLSNDAELELALNQLYPGAVADWFAARLQPPPVTNYREFTNRQSGMYRITTLLTDAQAGELIHLCCNQVACLKRRLWTVAALETDATDGKSIIPCLEPCAVLLEAARKTVRAAQEAGKLAGSELAAGNEMD